MFLRLAVSKDKEEVIAISQQNTLVSKPEDINRDSYIFEFLNLPERNHYSKKDLESALCEHLEHFLLELGKGFTFVAVAVSGSFIKVIFMARCCSARLMFLLLRIRSGVFSLCSWLYLAKASTALSRLLSTMAAWFTVRSLSKKE